jgi:hypothetical protein
MVSDTTRSGKKRQRINWIGAAFCTKLYYDYFWRRVMKVLFIILLFAAGVTGCSNPAFQGLTSGEKEGAGKMLALIRIPTLPNKVLYGWDQDLDLTGLKLTKKLTDGTTEDVVETITTDSVQGYNRYQEGAQTLTVSYGGETATFAIALMIMPDSQELSASAGSEFTVPIPALSGGVWKVTGYQNNAAIELGNPTVKDGNIAITAPSTAGDYIVLTLYTGKSVNFYRFYQLYVN